MTREEAKELLPIIQAFAEGKTLQYRVNEENNEWKDIDNPAFNDFSSEYRIKPEPKYRPFRTKEECWNEMHKHPDFGWLVHKNSKSMYHVTIIYYDGICLDINENSLNYLEAFDYYEFLDGTPFGIKED